MSTDIRFATGMALTVMALFGIVLWDVIAGQRRKITGRQETLLDAIAGRDGAMEVFIALFAFTVFHLFSNNNGTWYNNYSYLADAWLAGRLDVPDLPAYLESVQFGGATYVHFAPGAAVLCVPFVALFGIEGFDSALLCMALGAVNVALTYRVLTRLKMGDTRARLWMTALLGFGTVHFWCASWGSGWLLGHVSTLFYLLIAMCFLFDGREKPVNDFLSGLFFGLAVCCRLSALFGGIFFAGYILIYRKKKIRSLCCFAGGAAVFGSMYMLYNYVRFGTIMDESYSLTYLKDYHRAVYDELQQAPKEEQLALLKQYSKEYGGPLQLKFVSYNLYSIVAMLPEVTDSFPYLVPTVKGVALTVISPALLLAFLCKWKRPITWVLWATVIATAVPFLLNYGNGQSQFGMRYSMDFTPYLFLLAAMGMEKMRGWKKGLVLWSVLANAWGTLYWMCYYK